MDSTTTAEPTVITISKGDDALPSDAKELATGDEVCVYGKVTANDDQGLSVEVTRVEKAEGEPEPDADDTEAAPENSGDAGDEAAPADQGSPSSATNYVMKRRRQMMTE